MPRRHRLRRLVRRWAHAHGWQRRGGGGGGGLVEPRGGHDGGRALFKVLQPLPRLAVGRIVVEELSQWAQRERRARGAQRRQGAGVCGGVEACRATRVQSSMRGQKKEPRQEESGAQKKSGAQQMSAARRAVCACCLSYLRGDVLLRRLVARLLK